MKVRVKIRPSGLLNAQPWPEEGETLDLPDEVAEEMIAAGSLERVKSTAEKKPAEKKPAEKPAAAKKPDHAEKRPAANHKAETRKKS